MKVDFHSHILPAIDDGSQSLAESIEMLKMEAQQGISHVVATPHFYANSDKPERFLRRRLEAELRLRDELQKWPDLPEVIVGAEVYYFRGISECDMLSHLTIGNQSFILLEMPEVPWTNGMMAEVEQIYLKHEIVPVIAHVDRYISPFRTHGIPERLSQMPVLVQANAGCFLRRSTRTMALRMLRRGQIQLLGSDCHNVSSRPVNLGPVFQMIEKRMGLETINRIHEYGAHILNDIPLEV